MLYVQTYKNGYLVLLTFNVILKEKYKNRNEYMIKVMYPSQFSKSRIYINGATGLRALLIKLSSISIETLQTLRFVPVNK